MYNYGLRNFINCKGLKSNQAINLFLESEGITDFTVINHNRVNSYIEKNWTKFASFVDVGIKNGTLKGKAVKLNTHYDEVRERRDTIKNEFKHTNLSADQQELLDLIKKDGVGKIQSLLMKAGINPLPKDLQFTSKTLQWLPLVNQVIENKILINCNL